MRRQPVKVGAVSGEFSATGAETLFDLSKLLAEAISVVD